MEEDQFNSLKITSKITQKKVVFIIDFYEFFYIISRICIIIIAFNERNNWKHLNRLPKHARNWI